jgi:hypothetical protein
MIYEKKSSSIWLSCWIWNELHATITKLFLPWSTFQILFFIHFEFVESSPSENRNKQKYRIWYDVGNTHDIYLYLLHKVVLSTPRYNRNHSNFQNLVKLGNYCRCRGTVMVVIVYLQLPVQSVPKVVSSNPVHSIQHYVIKSVNDLRQVSVFLWVLLFPPSIKLTAMI